MGYRFHRNGYEVRAYHPGVKKLIYVGRTKTKEEAERLLATSRQHFGGIRRPQIDWEERYRALEQEIAESAADPEGSFVYFIQGKHGGPIKIGISTDPVARLQALQTGAPEELTIRKVIPGGIAKERELHSRFREHRLWGEWFAPSDELLDLCDGEPDEGQKVIALDFLERQNEALRTRVAELEAALFATRTALDTAWEASSVSPALRLPEPQPRAGEDDDPGTTQALPA